MTATVSWPVRRVEEIQTDNELYDLLVAFDPEDLAEVLIYRGDSVESGVTALERLHREYGE